MSVERDLDKAWDRLEAGNVEAARRIGRKLVVRDPGLPDALLLLAACAREEGDAEQALAHLTAARQSAPQWATPDLWAAEILAVDHDKLPRALEHATRALELAEEPDVRQEALALKAGLEVDLGDVAAARRTLSGADSPLAAAAADETALAIADLFLAVGEPEEARRHFRALADREPDMADAWYGLGMAAEASKDEKEKRRSWLRVLALDRTGRSGGPSLGEAEVAEVAETALGDLPERARRLLEGVPIIIADLPAKADVETGLDPRLLGLFEGTPYPDTSMLGGAPRLTQILLFRKNLERVASDEDHLRMEIRTTLLHETGHFFGMSEEDLAEVGLD